MKSIKSLKFANHIALVAIALCVSAGAGKAQDDYRGTFTLPFEAHWGAAVLPAGDYEIKMPSASGPYLLFVRGEGRTAMIMAAGVNTQEASDDSQLTIINNGKDRAIDTLRAGQLGLILHYAVPKPKMESRPRP